jgi:hypothetical protein
VPGPVLHLRPDIDHDDIAIPDAPQQRGGVHGLALDAVSEVGLPQAVDSPAPARRYSAVRKG